MTEIRLLTPQILYDIRNIAYVEGHLLEDEPELTHRRHLITDIGEEGNIDIVSRSLLPAYAGLQWALARGGLAPAPVYDDTLRLPDVLTLRLTVCLSHAHAELLTQLAHQFLVATALRHWLSITGGDAADKWKTRAQELETRICAIAAATHGTATRRLSPF